MICSSLCANVKSLFLCFPLIQKLLSLAPACEYSFVDFVIREKFRCVALYPVDYRMHDKININCFAAVEEININAVNNTVRQLTVVVDKNNALAQAKRNFEDPPEMKFYHTVTSIFSPTCTAV